MLCVKTRYRSGKAALNPCWKMKCGGWAYEKFAIQSQAGVEQTILILLPNSWSYITFKIELINNNNTWMRFRFRGGRKEQEELPIQCRAFIQRGDCISCYTLSVLVHVIGGGKNYYTLWIIPFWLIVWLFNKAITCNWGSCHAAVCFPKLSHSARDNPIEFSSINCVDCRYIS